MRASVLQIRLNFLLQAENRFWEEFMGSSKGPAKNHRPSAILTTHSTSQNYGSGTGSENGTVSGGSSSLRFKLVQLVILTVQNSKVGETVSIDAMSYTAVETSNGLIGNTPPKWRETLKKRESKVGFIVNLKQNPPEVEIEVN
jgi:hypothetical protein